MKIRVKIVFTFVYLSFGYLFSWFNRQIKTTVSKLNIEVLNLHFISYKSTVHYNFTKYKLLNDTPVMFISYKKFTPQKCYIMFSSFLSNHQLVQLSFMCKELSSTLCNPTSYFPIITFRVNSTYSEQTRVNFSVKNFRFHLFIVHFHCFTIHLLFAFFIVKNLAILICSFVYGQL